MPGAIKTGTILIREGARLPADLDVVSEVHAPGWRLVNNFNGFELGREAYRASWSLFYLADKITTRVLGGEGQEAIGRAVQGILAKLKGEKFNCLEITKVTPKHFLGIHFLSVSAHPRQLQEGMSLVSAMGFPLSGNSHSLSFRATATTLGGSEQERRKELVANRSVAIF